MTKKKKNQPKNLFTSQCRFFFLLPLESYLCVSEGAEVAGATLIAHHCILRDALNSVPPLLCASGAVPSRQLSNGAWRCKKRARGGRDRLRKGLCSLVPACKTQFSFVTWASPPHFLWGPPPPSPRAFLRPPLPLLSASIHFVCFPVAPYLMRCKSSVKVVHLSFGLFMPPTPPHPPPPPSTDGFMAPWVGVNVSWLASHPLCARTGARLKLSLVTLLLYWCLNSSPVCI